MPEELWPEILRKIDGPVAADTPADEFEDRDDAEDEYDPVESARQTRTAGLSAHAETDHPSKGSARLLRRAPAVEMSLSRAALKCLLHKQYSAPAGGLK